MKLSDLFYFPKSDRTVLLWLIILTAGIIGIFYFANPQPQDDLLIQAADSARNTGGRNYYSDNYSGRHYRTKGDGKSLYNNEKHYYNKGYGSSYPMPERNRGENLHPFELNYATPDEMLDLGFTEQEVRSVLKYRSKGGIYRRVEQLAKISGMTKGQYDRLAPYFYVSDDFKPAKEFIKDPTEKRESSTDNREPNIDNREPNPDASERIIKLKPGETVPLNSSDTTELKKVPGIGSVYSAMIVKYREKLGGFFSLEQLNDLEALPAETHKYFRLDPVPLRKLKINQLSVNRLVSHPYLNYYKARAIVEHIRTKGKLKSIHELQLNQNFKEQDILRLEPYMDYSEY